MRERGGRERWMGGWIVPVNHSRSTMHVCVCVSLTVSRQNIRFFLKMFFCLKSEQRRGCKKSTRSLSESAYFTNKRTLLRTVLSSTLKAAHRTKWRADNKLAIYQCQINMCVSCLECFFFFFLSFFNAGILHCAFMFTKYQNRQQHIVCAPKSSVSRLLVCTVFRLWAVQQKIVCFAFLGVWWNY